MKLTEFGEQNNMKNSKEMLIRFAEYMLMYFKDKFNIVVIILSIISSIITKFMILFLGYNKHFIPFFVSAIGTLLLAISVIRFAFKIRFLTINASRNIVIITILFVLTFLILSVYSIKLELN